MRDCVDGPLCMGSCHWVAAYIQEHGGDRSEELSVSLWGVYFLNDDGDGRSNHD